MKKINLMISFIAITGTMAAQNVGIGTASPIAKFHIKGAADTTQLLIDANSVQSNAKPMIKLRNSSGIELIRIHSDDTSNIFIGRNAGRVNDPGGGGNFNSFTGSRSGYSNTTGSFNTAYGYAAFYSNSTGYENTASGYGALYSNTTGYQNTANGKSALYSNTTGSFNTATGRNALFSNTTASNNTASGYAALLLNTTGSNNSASGYQALYSNTTGVYNTADGAYALYSNTTGIGNVAVGMNALYSNTTGNGNIAHGNDALYSNTAGYSNVGTGYEALYYNTTGTDNIAIGYQALKHNATGYDNVACGKNALLFNTTASGNTAIGVSALVGQSYSNGGTAWLSGNVAIGYQSLYSNQPTSTVNGIYNTAVGNSALTSNTTGAHNTGIGANALFSTTTGQFNTATGNEALKNNTASYNTATGSAALYSTTTGLSNVAIGAGALYLNTSGYYNTAVGTSALTNNIAGYSNIAIGDGSGTHPNTPNVYNTIGIGNDDLLNGFQDQVIIGNTHTWFIGGKVNWGVVSDARIKNTVTEDVKGLDFILRLRPVTYHISNKAIIAVTGNKETPDYPGKYDCEKIKYSGFLAQEVEQAAKAAAYEFSGYDAPKNEFGLYTIKYAEFVVPLVKAVQEQQSIIEAQNKKIEMLLKTIEEIKDKLK
jgi:hypothetical protein